MYSASRGEESVARNGLADFGDKAVQLQKFIRHDNAFPCLQLYTAKLQGHPFVVTAKVLNFNWPSTLGQLLRARDIITNENIVLHALRGIKGIPNVVAAYEMCESLAGIKEMFPPAVRFSLVPGPRSESRSRVGAIRYLMILCDCYLPACGSDECKSKTNLGEHLKHYGCLSESQALTILDRLLQVLDLIHQNNVAVLNLSHENVILDTIDMEILIPDLSVSRRLKVGEIFDGKVGHPEYMPPEMTMGKPYEGKSVDMWAVGVILYRMLYPGSPVDAEDYAELCRKSGSTKCNAPLVANVSSFATSMLKRLLMSDPTRRLTAGEALAKVRTHGERLAFAESKRNLQSQNLAEKTGKPGAETSLSLLQTEGPGNPGWLSENRCFTCLWIAIAAGCCTASGVAAWFLTNAVVSVQQY